MDKELTVQKWVLINRPKIPQIPRNLSAQIVCPSPKVWDFYENKIKKINPGLANKDYIFGLQTGQTGQTGKTAKAWTTEWTDWIAWIGQIDWIG